MARTVVCITKAFQRPRALSDLVVFSDPRPQVPAGDLSPYLRTCSNYARQHKVFLVPQRFVVKQQLYLCLFDPQGQLVGYQGALYRPVGQRTKLLQADAVQVLETAVGRLFLCVDVDLYAPEALRLARLKGAQIVISSQYMEPKDLKPRRIITGIWNAAQQQGLYVVGCCNLFSAVAAPWKLCPDGSGFLVQPEPRPELFCKLYLNKLPRAFLGGELAEQLNPDFCRRYAALLGQP